LFYYDIAHKVQHKKIEENKNMKYKKTEYKYPELELDNNNY